MERNVIGRRQLLGFLPAGAFLGILTSARAQGWPQRPVRILVPFAAGGNADFLARLVAGRLGKALGQPFVVECRPGASGTLAADAVARAAPDGYTLFMGSPSQISIAPLISKTAYDPLRDFTPISVIGTNPKVWAISGALPVTTFAEFIDYARKRPDQLAYVDAGVGSMPHLSTALVLKRAGLRMIRVSYKGSGSSTTDLAAGRVAVSFTNLATVMPFLADRSVKVLAVANEQRSPQIPTVPTFAEAGYPGIVIFTWNGLMAPAGTPRLIIDRIAVEVARAVRNPMIAERLISSGVDPVGNTPDEFAALIASDISLWTEAIKTAGLTAKD
ncbi:MAG TPA: tripartite tricarboxylate transporter substrate-binding protein [Xanthobacteraceae bacterium]|jgi:tripartite-type tricarboxylate transporter receptor subunit TctC